MPQGIGDGVEGFVTAKAFKEAFIQSKGLVKIGEDLQSFRLGISLIQYGRFRNEANVVCNIAIKKTV
jgi:hypothetical protein